MQLAVEMGIPQEQWDHVRRGTLLHDIGKMGVPDAILQKPGPLTDDEWAIMRTHPQKAREMLGAIDFLAPALDIPWCHHERWDGTGYPRGLAGEAIPLPARIFSVVDVYDALTSDRHYRPGWSHQQAIDYIREETGLQFDPRVVKAFFSLIGRGSGLETVL
jgi:HD-GYP domain-containing protein (c-di-GMP phosphodiesterase class II)